MSRGRARSKPRTFPPRSPPKLLRPCCLPCSQRYSRSPGLICARDRQDDNNSNSNDDRCRRCRRLGKKCDQIPPQFIRSVSRIQHAAGAAVALVKNKQRHYNYRVEAFLLAQRTGVLESQVSTMKDLIGVLRDYLASRRRSRPSPPHDAGANNSPPENSIASDGDSNRGRTDNNTAAGEVVDRGN